MTKERLEELEELMRLYPEGTHAVFVENKMERTWIMDAPMITEMVRLAKLGLWAEAVAVPDLQRVSMGGAEIIRPGRARDLLKELPDAARD